MTVSKHARGAFIFFEALRRFGWPANDIYFINATDAVTGRPCFFVTLQERKDTPPFLALRFAWADEVPHAMKEVGANIDRWNSDAAWRTDVWENRASCGFDDVAFSFLLVSRGLNVGPEKSA